MEDYLKAKKRYFTTLEIMEGTGSRGQLHIDKAYKKMQNAYNALTDDEKRKIKPLPAKYTSYDDGFGGLSGALGNLRR